MGVLDSCLVFEGSHPSELSGDHEGELDMLRVLQAPCLTRGLPGENVLLVMAGFPMPIFGATGMKVVEGTPPLDAGAA